MPDRTARFTILAIALAAAISVHAADAFPERTSNQSAVTVKVKPTSLKGPTWTFDVAFDTHSAPLTDDLMTEAMMLTPDGARLAPISWKADAPGGHHRKGVLRFSAPSPQPPSVELRITRPGEPAPRSFSWELK